MPVIESASISVNFDEPCLSLWEGNLSSDIPGYGWRRWQIIRVMRNDRIAEYREDMGSSLGFTATGIYLPGGLIVLNDGTEETIPLDIPYDQIRRIEIQATVGRLIDAADYHRGETNWLDQIEPPVEFQDGYAYFTEVYNKAIRKNDEVKSLKSLRSGAA